MAAEDLPSEFDVVILGTGLTESVVAAACSRVGQRVLHLDTRSYYAAKWASFTFNTLLTWIERHQEQSQGDEVQDQDWSSLLEEGEEPICVSKTDSASITNLQVFCYTSEDHEVDDREKNIEEGSCAEAEPKETEQQTEEVEAGHTEKESGLPRPQDAASQSEPNKKITLDCLVKEGRRFNIDLVSKLMYARGSLVDLLIKSNVSRYAEFKNITRILTYRHGNVEQVPCSRADVFASRQLSVVEKRKLMRFLTSCMEDAEEHEATSARTYLEFLHDQQLSDNLRHFLLHSIAMVTEDTPTRVGLASTRHFLRCLGRYGNTPFLFPVYGLGEIPQCFCRMCAVFGGVYCLRHPVSCLLLDKTTNRCKAVIDSRGQRITGSHFVLEDSYLSPDFREMATPARLISRAVLITDGSILPGDSEQQVSLVTVPPMEAGHPSVRMVELCPSTMTCMPGTYLVHLTCQSLGSAYEDLSPVVNRMFRTPESHDQAERPSVLWCLYFNMEDGSSVELQGRQVPSNVYLCSGPDGALGHEHAIGQAEFIFHKIVPEEDFCPPAPNPEDIIYDGDNTNPDQEGEGGEEVQNLHEE
uniref:rab proteins geranylgeranyltransferase component A 1 isoform X2 n=1 Tax=Doryrhamphus excisus TaxID=161450 RepID=UPI0025ADDBC2|nr:rab proteins geranylgeranyltransferase component A 1 isoform X2 [Doryrhamphus excisus]